MPVLLGSPTLKVTSCVKLQASGICGTKTAPVLLVKVPLIEEGVSPVSFRAWSLGKPC